MRAGDRVEYVLSTSRKGNDAWGWWYEQFFLVATITHVGPRLVTIRPDGARSRNVLPCQLRRVSPHTKTLNGLSPRSEIALSDDRDQAKATPTDPVSPFNVA